MHFLRLKERWSLGIWMKQGCGQAAKGTCGLPNQFSPKGFHLCHSLSYLCHSLSFLCLATLIRVSIRRDTKLEGPVVVGLQKGS